jgi:hypothetical protein
VTRDFVLTQDHLKLLRAANIGWNGDEFGAPSMDPKRPYGNSDVIRDIMENLGWAGADEEGEPTDAIVKEADYLHKSMETALQILCYHADVGVKTGRYRETSFQCWKYIGPE